MTKPTIGRVLWYHPADADGFNYMELPLAAIVSYVNEDDSVNLAVFDAKGNPYGKTDVPLVQEGDKPPEDAHENAGYCEWPQAQQHDRDMHDHKKERAHKDQESKGLAPSKGFASSGPSRSK